MSDRRLAFLARARELHDLVEADTIDLDEAFASLGLPACETCGGQPCVNPSLCEACRRTDARLRRERR